MFDLLNIYLLPAVSLVRRVRKNTRGMPDSLLVGRQVTAPLRAISRYSGYPPHYFSLFPSLPL